jgi:hypothetical protein
LFAEQITAWKENCLQGNAAVVNQSKEEKRQALLVRNEVKELNGNCVGKTRRWRRPLRYWSLEKRCMRSGGRARTNDRCPGDWQSSIESAAELDAPTLRAVPVQGAHLILLMTFIPKRQTVGMDAVVLDKIMQGIHEQHAGNPGETRVASRAIKPIFAAGVGHVLTYVDETLLSNQSRATEDFAYITTGALLIEGMVVSISILSNGIESENYVKALLGVATLLYEAPTI